MIVKTHKTHHASYFMAGYDAYIAPKNYHTRQNIPLHRSLLVNSMLMLFKSSWRTHFVSGIIFINICWIAMRQIQIKLLISQVQYSKTQFGLLLIHLAC